MYLSGTLLNKTIQFCQEELTSFDQEMIGSSKFDINYQGEIMAPHWEEEKLKKLSSKQELYIRRGIEKTKNLIISNENNIKIRKDLLTLINHIFKTPRKISYILFETLYQKLTQTKTLSEFQNILISFYNLLSFLENNIDISQIDLRIIISLWNKNLEYSWDNIREEKRRYFQINEEELTEEKRTLLLLGEFISPKRVPIIAQTLIKEEEFSKFILPIYFTLKDYSQAKRFLNACRTPNLNELEIEKNAKKCRVPNNLIEMIRR